MPHDPATPPPLDGRRDGLAYTLFLPEGEPAGGVVVVHGAGSNRNSHADFAVRARAAGLVACTFDARGHGASDGLFGPGAFEDVLTMAALVREHAPTVALRGSSLGGFCAIHAAVLDPAVVAVVAICPAPEELLRVGLEAGVFEAMRVDVEAASAWLQSADLRGAVEALGPDTALMLVHAEGDEAVPVEVSRELHAAAHEPKRLLIAPGGDHRSAQHDPALQDATIAFIRERFAA